MAEVAEAPAQTKPKRVAKHSPPENAEPVKSTIPMPPGLKASAVPAVGPGATAAEPEKPVPVFRKGDRVWLWLRGPDGETLECFPADVIFLPIGQPGCYAVNELTLASFGGFGAAGHPSVRASADPCENCITVRD